MTSGDGEHPSAADSSADVPAASAAELCYDSDDLLTTRRGGLPIVRPRPGNGHVTTPDSVPDQYYSGVEMPAPGEIDVPRMETPIVAETSETPPTVAEAVSEPMAATPTAADLVQEPVIPLPPVDATGTAGSPAGPTLTIDEEQTQGIGAFDAQQEPERDAWRGHAGSTVADAPLVVTASEPAAPDEGAEWHSAGTAEYTAIDHPVLTEQPDGFVLAPTAMDIPVSETNDIEIPIPVAVDEPATAAAYAPALDEPEAAIVLDHMAAPAGETIDLPVSQWDLDPMVATDPDTPALPPTEPPAPPLAATPPPPPAAPPPDDEEEAGATMTIIEHLEELRHRVTISAISIVVGAVIGWFIVPHVVQYLEDSARNLGGKFFSPTILGPFGLELKLSFLIGLIISSPMVLYQIWGFIAPGLTRHERRYALPFSLIGGALFAGGAVTGVLIVPLAIRFLIHFFSVLDLEQLLDIDKYIMFIALIAVIFGITFELPIFMVGFSLLGVVNSRFFIQKFRIAIFVIYGVSMVITPGADLISPLVLGTFLIVLYWLGVLLIRVIGR